MRPSSSQNNTPHFLHERALGGFVAGIDEAGRGPLAGPVVAAAVIFPSAETIPPGINDSKKLSATRREALFEHICAHTYHGVGIASVDEIDHLNILQATMLAMQRAFEALPTTPSAALIDGNRAPKLPVPTHTLIGGDAISLSIAAASIVAKTIRDRHMAELHAAHPHYGWDTNAGYGTQPHLDALERHGLTPHHRRSFAPIRQRLLLVS